MISRTKTTVLSVLATLLLAHGVVYAVSCDRIIGVNAPAGGARLVKHFDIPPGTVVTDIEFISNDFRTVFPKVVILEGTADEMAEGVIRAQFLNIGPSQRHRVHLDCGSLTLSGDIYVAITLPTSTGVKNVGDGAGIGGMQLSSPDGNNFIASASDGRFEPVDVNLAVYFNSGGIGKATTGPIPTPNTQAVKEAYLHAAASTGGPTTIAFGVAESGSVSITIYDVAGRTIRRFPTESLASGAYERMWGGLDASGRSAAAGVYVVHLSTAGKRLTRKVVLAR